jgi:hypothetical protein
MAISLLRMIQQIGRGRSSYVPPRPHVMLAGISQTVFLKNWGEPDVEIYLRKLGRLSEKGTLYLTVNSGEKADHAVWIYRKKDRILFFAEKKLHCHFKWSGFDRERNRLKNGNNEEPRSFCQTVAAHSLALVA